MWNYAAFSIARMHSSTLAFFVIAAIKASWVTLLFFKIEAANRTCNHELLKHKRATFIFGTYQTVNIDSIWKHTAHLVRFCCWSLLRGGLVLLINLCRNKKQFFLVLLLDIIVSSIISTSYKKIEILNLETEKISRLTNHLVIC